MKKILITGANSYIGTSFENYIKKWPVEYSVDTVDMIDGSWREKDFSGYDVVFHVAGIAHIKETKENADLYYKVNRDLAIETAGKAKSEGVKQFILLSSMSVYGMETGVITKNTIPNPKSNYGKSKYMADERIKEMASDDYKVAILRPPMVYGKGCKGNYQTVIKIVKMSPVFPNVKNNRSMISIDNLVDFVKKVIDGECVGIYCPQNKEYMQTSQMAVEIANELGKKIHLSIILGTIVKLFMPFARILKKSFGTLIYKLDDDSNKIDDI